jgi:transposase
MKSADTLFDIGREVELKRSDAPPTVARDVAMLRPIRSQAFLPKLAWTLDDMIPADHPVRAIWTVVAALDLTAFEAEIASNGRQGGRPAIDVRILLALWIFATTKGEGRASEIARLCTEHWAYLWICGGVSVGERTLSEFRVTHGAALDQLLTQTVAIFIVEDLVEVSRTTQDGTRVRASAGTGSFRRMKSLQAALDEARAHLDAVKAAARNPRDSEVRRAAKERGAADRVKRIEDAVERMREIAREKKLTDEDLAAPKGAPRLSTTDPEATVMKMGDGGFRPAYNIQFATAADRSGVILGVDVTMRGSDQHEAAPMLEQLKERTGRHPDEHLVDAGYASHEDVEKAEAVHTKLLAPLPKNLAAPGSDRDKEYSQASRAWIERMNSEEAKSVYKLRGECAELTNARAKSRYGLSMLTVRGLVAVTCCTLLVAITANIERLISLRARGDTPAVLVVSAPSA